MAGGGAKSAKDISVAETFELLDKDFNAVAKAFDDQQFALWVGSGISFLRAPNLGELIRLALEHLRTRITTNDADDKFALTLKAALKMGSEIDTIWCPSSTHVSTSPKCSMPHRPSFANAPRRISAGIAAGGHFGAIGT